MTDAPPEQDHYGVLGVTSTATLKEIKPAARKLYLVHHPDKGGSSAQFRKVREAEDILKDGDKRSGFDARYEEVRLAWQAYQLKQAQALREQENARRRKQEEADRLARERMRQARAAEELQAQQRLAAQRAEEKRKLQERIKAQEEADRRTQEVLRKAQAARELQAQQRLAAARAEEERILRERLKAQEEERLHAEMLRRALLAHQAEIRSEAAAEKRRQELEMQATSRLRQQLHDEQMQERAKLWSQWYNDMQSPSVHTAQAESLQPRISCAGHVWAKKKGKDTCKTCVSTSKQLLFLCLECRVLCCQNCRSKPAF